MFLSFFFFKQKTAYEMRISDWSSDVCSSDLGAAIIGGVLFAHYLVDVKNEIRRYDLKGAPLGNVALPGIGSVVGFGGEQNDSETFYAFTSLATPTTIYRYDIAADESSVWAAPQVDFNPDDYAVEQTFFDSKDGTRVPLLVVGRKNLPARPQTTILYRHGGYDIHRTGQSSVWGRVVN